MGLVFSGVFGGLLALSSYAERHGAYPFKYEDWLRYLLPTLWPHDRRLMLVTGPSNAREGFRIEVMQRAMPEYRVFNGAISLGTLSDVLLSLEYIEGAYGAEALPEVVVLGLSPRFVLGAPRKRPFARAINRYSARFSVVRGDVPKLREKSWAEGLISEARFLGTKQAARFRAALIYTSDTLIADELGRLVDTSPIAPVFSTAVSRMGWQEVRYLGVAGALQHGFSPYRYVGPPKRIKSLVHWMNEKDGWWQTVHAWDARPTPEITTAANALVAFARSRGIRLVPVSLPERSLSRDRFPDGFDAAYSALLRRLFPMPLLDLRCLLPEKDFFDLEHALPEAAVRQTHRTVGFLHELLANEEAVEARLDRWAAGCGGAA
jgi:hypothetical protein